jgi:hypothetical protein
MALEIVASRPEGITADERWSAWVAKGVEHDRKIRKRAGAAFMAIAAGMVVWLSIVLLQ